MRFATAAGALVASRLACADAMPDAVDVELMLCVVRFCDDPRTRGFALRGAAPQSNHAFQ